MNIPPDIHQIQICIFEFVRWARPIFESGGLFYLRHSCWCEFAHALERSAGVVLKTHQLRVGRLIDITLFEG